MSQNPNPNYYQHSDGIQSKRRAVYYVYGLDRCDAENIEDLDGLIGERFAVAFYKRYRILFAQDKIATLRVEVASKLAEISALESQIAEYSVV